MPSLTIRHRHDPFWDLDGPAARGARRRRRLREGLAFTASLVAVAGSLLAWGLHLGLAQLPAIALMVRPG